MTDRPPRWIWPIVIGTLLAGAGLLSWSLRESFAGQIGLARQETREQLRLLATLVAEDLQEDRYQDIEPLLARLAQSNTRIAHLQLTSRNGFVLANYQRSGEVRHSLELETSVPYSYDRAASLRLGLDLASVYGSQRHLVAEVAAIYLIASVLVLVLVYVALKRQREAVVLRQRTHALDLAREVIADREARLRAILETEPDGVMIVGGDGRLTEMNPAGLAMLEADSNADVCKRPLTDFVAAESRDACMDAHRRVMAGSDETLEFEATGLRGGSRWLEMHATPLRDARGTSTDLLAITRDITARKIADTRIRSLNRTYAVLSGINSLIVRAHSPDELFRETCRIAVEVGQLRMAWIGIVDRGAQLVKPVAWHGDARELLDSGPLATNAANSLEFGLVGRAVVQQAPFVSNDVKNDPKTRMKTQLAALGINSFAIIPMMIAGEAVGVLGLYSLLIGFFDEEEMRLLTELARDISFALNHLRTAERLDYASRYDALTGVANRDLFNDRLIQTVYSAESQQGRFALVLFNIERFKAINDSLGRPAGDELLKQVARRLVKFATDPDRVGRIGADNFALICPGAGGIDAVTSIVEELTRACFGDLFQLGSETRMPIAGIFGISLYPQDGSSAETIYRSAEAALKRAKDSGERILFHAPQMTEGAAEKFLLENSLRFALERNEFVLHYQPKVDVRTRCITGVEALLRWQSPDLGLVQPTRFISLLEETGMILEVGAWVMKQAVLDHRRWSSQGLAAPRVAVNVSPIQLRKRDFVNTVREAIALGASPPAVDLEITETHITDDVEENIEKLALIRDMGITIAVDDFGTGYSSLRYLARLPVHAIKIDRSFVITMCSDSNVLKLVSTIITMAHSLNLKVVAEGVDEEEQAETLLALHCDEMQGYLISKPVPHDSLAVLLAADSRTA